MYLSKSGLFIFFGGGILFLLTVGLFVTGSSALLGQVWLAVAFVVGIAVFAWLGSKVIKEIDRRTIENVPREYIAERQGFSLHPYWALRLLSLLLKVIAAALLMFWVLLLVVYLLRLARLASPQDVLTTLALLGVSSGFLLPTVMFQGFVVSVAFYAGGQLITLLLSVESSLKILATRRRQTEPS